MHSAQASGRRPASGFTILELLIVVALAAILLVVGVPVFKDFGARQRMSAAMHAMHGQLAGAREAAIHNGTTVVTCPGTPESGCLEGSDWSEGWFIFSDFNADSVYQSGETLHWIEPGLEHIAIRSTSGRQLIRFYSGGSAPGSNTTITFCDDRGPPKARKLVISNTGRIRREEAPETDPASCHGA